MSARETVKLGPFNLPPRLKGKIARRVETKNTNLNDLVVGLLAERAGLTFEPTGRKSPGPLSPYQRILLDAPPELARWVRTRADEAGESQRDVVVRILSEELGVPFQPGGRWPTRTTEIAS